MLEVENRTALLRPGYDLTLNSLALDMMHADFDLITGLLGRPSTCSAATILFDYPEATA
jgi:hypothetical protein